MSQACCSRRRFLGGAAATGATAVVTSLFGDAVRQASFGATRGGNVLVVVSLRGGIDGLGVVVPHGEPSYYASRPTIAVPKSRLLVPDQLFGLHPQLAPLTWLWEAGEMAAVHAAGLEMPNRSHFAAMEAIEDADPTSSVRSGWVNRMAGLGGGTDATEVVHLGTATAPTLVSGPAPSVSAQNLRQVSLAGSEDGWAARRMRQLQTVWADAPGPLGAGAASAMSTVGSLAPLLRTPYVPDVDYPTEWPGTDFAQALQDTARLVKADLGTEVVSIDYGNWDLHDGYGGPDSGRMSSSLRAFARAVDAFMRDLGPLRSRVTLVTISEFGRRLSENGNRGLDHGWGNMMLLVGGGVRGGRYHGRWPGLGAAKDVAADVAVTTDYRQVLGEVVHRRFPDRAVSSVFPGLRYDPIGVMAG